MSLSPQQVIDSAEGLSGLATILADFDAYQEKLSEMKQHALDGKTAYDNAIDARNEAKAMLEKAQVLSTEAESIKSSYEDIRKNFDASMSNQKQELEDRSLELSKLSMYLLDTEKAQANINTVLEAKAEELRVREKQTKGTEKSLELQMTKATEAEQKYNSLISNLKATIG